MLDSYTCSMCINSWGRSSFARCLIEVKADDVLKESITMGIPLTDGSGFSKETVRVECGNHLITMVNRKKNGKTGSNSNSTNQQ
ncbi:hypothetical protein Tco_0547557 [Tanacetum coccineum]